MASSGSLFNPTHVWVASTVPAKRKHEGLMIGLENLEGNKYVRIFGSPCLTLIVGREKREFIVHQAVLSQSPVLKGMCRPDVVEAATQIIYLSEDGSKLIDILVRFLYTGRLPFLVRTQPGKEKLDTLADIYIVAEKYQLGYMQEKVLVELTSSITSNLSNGDPMSAHLLQVYRRIYQAIPESKLQIRDYFIKEAPNLIENLTVEERDELGTWIYKGGAFAQDVYKALCERYIKKELLSSCVGTRSTFSNLPVSQDPANFGQGPCTLFEGDSPKS